MLGHGWEITVLFYVDVITYTWPNPDAGLTNIYLENRSLALPTMWLFNLTHWGRVTHICVAELGHHWFRQWFVACSVPGHFLDQCWLIVNWTPKNIYIFYRNSYIFIQENESENVVRKIVAIMSRPQCANRCITELPQTLGELQCTGSSRDWWELTPFFKGHW